MFDPREMKAAPISPIVKSAPDLSFTEFLLTGGNDDLSAMLAIALYEEAMPLFNAVSMRAKAFSQIPLRVRDKRTKKFVDDHPVLQLLENPNADTTKLEFFEQISSFYDITGNSYITATGRINAPPLEIYSTKPQDVTFGSTSPFFDAFDTPASITVNSNVSGSSQYFAEQIINMGLRYQTKAGDREIWHMRTFNPRRSSTNFRGLSPARPIWLEIEQYLSGNKTNLSLLKRGTKLSLAWVNNRGEELTDTQWDRLQEEAQKYKGEYNAGGTPILDGMDVKSIQQTNRDMEFKDLQESMLARVSTAYSIPLAMMLAQSMTLNNLETSALQFYDMSVIPLARRLLNELTVFLMPRYKGSENLELWYNEADIPALRARMINTSKELAGIGSFTDNEVRNEVAFDEIDNGDTVYKPANLIPIDEEFSSNDDATFADDNSESVNNNAE